VREEWLKPGLKSPAKAGSGSWGDADHHMNVMATWEPAKARLRRGGRASPDGLAAVRISWKSWMLGWDEASRRKGPLLTIQENGIANMSTVPEIPSPKSESVDLAQ